MTTKNSVAAEALKACTKDKHRPGDLVSQDCDRYIAAFLADYWVRSGLTPEEAERAARKAVEKLKNSCSDRTWCLLPEV